MGLGKVQSTDVFRRNKKTDGIIQDQQHNKCLTGSTEQMGKTCSTGKMGLDKAKSMDGIMEDSPIKDKQDKQY
jgi:hypothetical protein